jgi:hypothetical protein
MIVLRSSVTFWNSMQGGAAELVDRVLRDDREVPCMMRGMAIRSARGVLMPRSAERCVRRVPVPRS